MRVYELAKKLGISTRKILLIIKELKIRRKTPLSKLKDKEIEKIEKFLKKETKSGEKEAKKRKAKITKEIKKEVEEQAISSIRGKKEKEEKPKEIFIDRGKEIPMKYGIEHLVILPVDPHKIFAYWELEKTRESEAVLRVYYEGRKKFFDVNIKIDAMNWYVDVPEDGVDYQAELGIIDKGRFVPLLRSNKIKLPRKTMSEEEEVKVARFKELIKKFKLDVKGRSSLERVRFEEIKEFLKRFKFAPSSRKK